MGLAKISQSLQFSFQRSFGFYFVLIALFLCYLLYVHTTPVAIYGNAVHDDGWFMQRALLILEGQWFGPYDSMTLVKGPTYPLFIVFANILPFSIDFP